MRFNSLASPESIYIYNRFKKGNMKNKVKINFFENQLDYFLTFQEKLDQIRSSLKQVFIQEKLNLQLNTLINVNKRILNEVQVVKKEIDHIRFDSDLVFDESKVQGQLILKSVEEKVQQLSQRLYSAENGVQKAENIKRQMDALRIDYEMSNSKNFKKQQQSKTISNYLGSYDNIKQQFKRSIELMMKIHQKYSQTHNNHQEDLRTELEKLLRLKNQGNKFIQLRRMANYQQYPRRCKSLDYHRVQLDQSVIPAKPNIKKPLMILLLTSPGIKQKSQRQQALKSLVLHLKLKNKRQAALNKLLADGLELKNRDQVLKYLQGKTNKQLTEEQCLMKLSLMGSIEKIQNNQRFLSLRGKRKCKQEYQNGSKRWKCIKKRRVKSVEKLFNPPQTVNKRSTWNTKQVLEQFEEKAQSSNPKTNESESLACNL